MSNKAIISLLVCLVGIIFSTLLLLKKDVRRISTVSKQQVPFEVQSASAQGMLLSGKYEFANRLFESSYSHFKDNPAFIERYASSLSASGERKKALEILSKAGNDFPLHKGLRLQSAQTLILDNQSSKAYALLTSMPLFNHKEPRYLSLIILSTPNSQALDSLMSKMSAFPNFRQYFTQELLAASINKKFLENYFSKNG